MLDNGRTTLCMAREPTSGLMAECIMVAMLMIRKMALVFTSGSMAALTSVTGSKESKTVSESTSFLMAQ